MEHVCNKVSKSIRIANIVWPNTYKSNLISLYRHQKHVIRIIYDKDRFTHTKLLFKHAKKIKGI